ncbi:MAG: amidohydrolase family protein [Eubacterium sp.]|nr:amidohydrolase family protein [Eubacterium sp.]
MNGNLFECHGHLLMDGTDYAKARKRHEKGPDEEIIRAELAALKQTGIGYFRDGGDACGVCLAARDYAPEYGIEYVTPGFAIHKKGRYGDIVGRSFTDYADFRTRLFEVKACGGTFVKIMLSGIITFKTYGGLSCESLPPDEIKELANIAHGEGFPVMVHVNGREAIEAAASCVDSIEHGYFGDEDALSAMAESGTVWVPTLAAVAAFVGRPGFDEHIAARTLETQLVMLKKAEELGVSIACGSDSGAVGVPHGEGTLAEMRLLKRAGLAPETISAGNEKIRRVFRAG